MISEYSSIMEKETWELVPPSEDQNIVGCRWVLKAKRNKLNELRNVIFKQKEQITIHVFEIITCFS
jgi:hypothetical protein